MSLKKKFAKTLKRLIILISITGIFSFSTYLVVLKYNGEDHSEALNYSEIIGVIGLFGGFFIILWYPLVWIFKNARD
jgi:hypothetical protein